MSALPENNDVMRAPAIAPQPQDKRELRRSAKRRRAEKRFRAMGIGGIALAGSMLAFLIVSVSADGISVFRHSEIALEVKEDMRESLKVLFTDVQGRTARRELRGLLSAWADEEYSEALKTHETGYIWVRTSDETDLYFKNVGASDDGEDDFGALSDRQVGWLNTLKEEGRARFFLDWGLFTYSDSREPEHAGIRAAAVGSFFALLLVFVLSFPIGVFAAIYLEELAPDNFWTRLIEVNINNLAAVSSIVYGLLGFALFLTFFSLPRSSALVGGLVLGLMTLPTIIIAGRATLKAVPSSQRDAALALGASRLQSIFHHVLPAALPGIFTGTILGMSRALGETAPLLMIGMVAFIAEPPSNFTDPATVLPVQIYLWFDSPEPAFTAKASAAILVLLVFLAVMNALAVILRKRFEQRW